MAVARGPAGDGHDAQQDTDRCLRASGVAERAARNLLLERLGRRPRTNVTRGPLAGAPLIVVPAVGWG
jgi:hypothetical protein